MSPSSRGFIGIHVTDWFAESIVVIGIGVMGKVLWQAGQHVFFLHFGAIKGRRRTNFVQRPRCFLLALVGLSGSNKYFLRLHRRSLSQNRTIILRDA